MNTVSVLDCTLRDGGYCNQWKFGFQNIKRIITELINAKIDIIECGFLTNRVEYDRGISKYTDINQLGEIIPSGDARERFVVMVNYGEYEVDTIVNCSEAPIGGIRLAFHKKDYKDALQQCRMLKEKGYRVFVQPMVSMNYSDDEFVDLIRCANEVEPYAFYIVDSFGTMKRQQLFHYIQLVKKHLKESIVLGFHSHNNFQFAFSNAIDLVEQNTTRDLIIDTSVYGMGRGAGNLNTELFINELNMERKCDYAIKPLVSIMDEILNRFYKENPWGYSFPNYLSAAYGIHPNYATFLCEKDTLTIDAIDDIFSIMDKEKMVEFDPKYVEHLYEDYMSREKVNDEHIDEFRSMLSGRTILLIAPGKTAEVENKQIRDFIEQESALVISINHEYEKVTPDYVFVSNMRRFKKLSKDVYEKTLVTSNIKSTGVYMKLNYYLLLNDIPAVRENAGLMAINLLKQMECKDIWLAGYDGYDYAASNNYESDDMVLSMSREQVDQINAGMKQMIEDYSQAINIRFLTDSRLNV